MEIRHLRYFLAIADHGSITGAAAQLFVAQPSLTRQLHDLERDVGAALFTRTSRGMTLTRAGVQLLPRAQHAVEAFADLLPPAPPAELRAPCAEHILRVGVQGAGLGSLTPVVASLLRHEYPGVVLRLSSLTVSELIGAPTAGHHHAVLATSGLFTERDDWSFDPLFSSRAVAVMAPGMPGSHEPRIDLAQVRELPGLSLPGVPRSWSAPYLPGEERNRPPVLLSPAERLETYGDMVSHTLRLGDIVTVLGSAELSLSVLRPLAAIPVDGAAPLTYGIYTRRSRTPDPDRQGRPPVFALRDAALRALHTFPELAPGPTAVAADFPPR